MLEACPPRPKVLVVDDEFDISSFVCEAAERQGYDAVALNDPEKFTRESLADVNLIFLEVDGIELIRYLAEIRSQISMVIFSGTDRAILHSAKELAMAHGLDVLGVVQKPVRLADLKQIFSRYVRPMQKNSFENAAFDCPPGESLVLAIENGGLSLDCQPQINLQSGTLTGVEMLVRWTHPEQGAIAPACFVPMAEKTGLIDELTSFVISESLRHAGAWRAEGHDLRVSINMSPLTLTDIELPEKLDDLARANNVDPENLVIEVTETALAQNIVRYLDILTRLRLKGFRLSIDDFGTGYSTIGQLLRAPFNELKIDRSFVKNIHEKKENRVIVSSSIKMAHDLGLSVIAEGIETQEDWNFLVDHGCDDGQGFLMARPMPTTDLVTWIEHGNN